MSRMLSLLKRIDPMNMEWLEKDELRDPKMLGWSVQNIRAAVVFDNAIFLRFYVKPYCHDSLFAKYSIEPPKENGWEEDGSVIVKLLSMDSTIEELLVFSSNKDLLDFERNAIEGLPALTEQSLRLRDIGTYYVQPDFDVEKAFEDIKQFWGNRVCSPILHELFKEYSYGERLMQYQNNIWYMYCVKHSYSVLKDGPLKYEIQEAMKKIYQEAILPEFVEERVENMLCTYADKYSDDLEKYDSIAATWLENLSKIVKSRVAIEQMLTHWRLHIETKYPDKPDLWYVSNYYCNKTAANYIYGSINDIYGFDHVLFSYTIESRFSEINYAFMAELAKKTGNNNLYEFFVKFPYLSKYITSDYLWEEYITPNQSFEFADVENMTIDDYSAQVMQALENRTPPAIREKGNCGGGERIEKFIKILDKKPKKDVKLTISENFCDVRSVFEDLERLMDTVFKTELISCYKTYFEIMPLFVPYLFSRRMPTICNDDLTCYIYSQIHLAASKYNNDIPTMFIKKGGWEYFAFNELTQQLHMSPVFNKLIEKMYLTNCVKDQSSDHLFENSNSYAGVSDYICKIYRGLFDAFRYHEKLMLKGTGYEGPQFILCYDDRNRWNNF